MKLQAIRNVFDRPSGGYHIGEDNEKLFWTDGMGGEKPLTEEELAKVEVEYKKIKKEYDDLAYTRNRVREYPEWTVQLEKIYDDGVDKWKTEMVNPVKTKWPKDNSGPVE